MKKQLFFVTMILMAAILVMTAPAAAALKTPVGERIYVNADDQSFPPGEPFHIMHGWIFFPAPGEGMRGLYRFDLEVDGVYEEADFVVYAVQDGVLGIHWVFNYPGGMTGTHTFTGHWIAPCKAFEEWFGPCANPVEELEWSQSATVIFEE
jgi:hypothetical protein